MSTSAANTTASVAAMNEPFTVSSLLLTLLTMCGDDRPELARRFGWSVAQLDSLLDHGGEVSEVVAENLLALFEPQRP